jgi:hypothetical protein
VSINSEEVQLTLQVCVPTDGYVLVVDGQMKAEFKMKDGALKAARDLKSRIPRLQVKVYDAEEKRSEEIELPAA